MRDIKFRIYNKSQKVMVNWLELINDGWNLFELTEGEDVNWSAPMQYTGLKDKNNKEIYEGDILMSEKGVSTVYFINGGFKTAYVSLGSNHRQHTVIGNVHENPELLRSASSKQNHSIK